MALNFATGTGEVCDGAAMECVSDPDTDDGKFCAPYEGAGRARRALAGWDLRASRGCVAGVLKPCHASNQLFGKWGGASAPGRNACHG